MSEQLRIITADCSYPKEIDDGVFVERVDESFEAYSVNVCVADTSPLHKDPAVVSEAHANTTAKYWDLPNGERGYDPMIDPSHIRNFELLEGTRRNAMVVSFVVGTQLSPSQVAVRFEEVEVVKNLSYKDFSNFVCGPGHDYKQASDLIKEKLRYVAYGDHAGDRPAWREDEPATHNLSGSAWKRGSKLNEAFMVAANHLVGKLMEEEQRSIIYRVYDPSDEQHIELLSPNVAWFSRTPGPHVALNLYPYARVTSPLRRLDDFENNWQMRLRDMGKEPAAADIKGVAFAIRRLNQEIVANAPREASQYSRRDILGRAAGTGSVALAVGE